MWWMPSATLKIATGAANDHGHEEADGGLPFRFVVNTPYFKDGFSYPDRVGSLHRLYHLPAKVINMKERNIRMRFGVGGLTKSCATC